MVRAKFKVVNININMGQKDIGTPEKSNWVSCEGRTIRLSPVQASDKNPENKIFGIASPSGEISIYILNKEAFQQFEIDKEYYVDFTPA